MSSAMQNNSNKDALIAELYDIRLPTGILLTLFSVIGVPGNLLVVIVYWKENKMNNTNFLIFIMAIVDFIGALTAFLTALVYTVLYEFLDVKYCKIIITLTFSSNTPAMYLIFGVSVIRYYHVCKPQMVYYIQKKVKPFCICVLILALAVAVLYAICTGRTPSKDRPGLMGCDVSNKYKYCMLATQITLIFTSSSYLFCLTGLIVLNIRILRKYTKLYRRVQQYKHANAKPKKNVKKTSKQESIPETTKSLNKSIDDLTHIRDDTLSWKKYNVEDTFSGKSQSTKNDDNKSCGTSNMDSVKTSPLNKEEFKLFDNVKNKSVNPDPIQKEFREGDSCKSERISVGVRNKDKVKNEENDHSNVQKCHTKVISSPDNTINDCVTNEEHTDKQLQKRCCKKCLHKLTFPFKFEGFNKTTLKLSFVSLAYICIYLPWFVVEGYIRFRGITKIDNYVLDKYVIQPIRMLPFAGSAVNPVIYAFVDPKFRSQCRKLFKK